MGKTIYWKLMGISFCLLAFEGTAAAQGAEFVEPDVMLIIDTSGSMDWIDDKDRAPGVSQWQHSRNACENHSNTSATRTSWQKLQDAFLGSIPSGNYRCAVHEPMERPQLHALREEDLTDYLPDNISEYRSVSYPHFRSVNCPSHTSNWDTTYDQCILTGSGADATEINGITACNQTTDPDTNDLYEAAPGGPFYCLDLHPLGEARRSDGILDSFGSIARFGALTYDNLPKCWDECWEGGSFDPHLARWDYGPYRTWKCGLSSKVSAVSEGSLCVDWNAGARGGTAQGYEGAVGGLVGIGLNPDDTNHRVEQLLESAEPLFCSPLGSLIDDVGHYFAQEPNVKPVSTGGNGTDYYYRCRPKIVVLISDGQPTNAFEFMAGGCVSTDSESDSTPENWDPMNPPTYTHANPPTTARNAPGTDEKLFDCPWRSSPEEAAELFDVGKRMLGSEIGNTNCDYNGTEDPSDDCEPIYLVVIGFNVPEVDCEVNPDQCYEYNAAYPRCWHGLPECTEALEPCLMNPRQLLNEIACQGWPYSIATPYSTNYDGWSSLAHSTNRPPPWLEHPDDICGPASAADTDQYLCLEENGHVERALFVNNVTKLKAVMEMILADVSSHVVTRTDLVAWNNPDALTNADIGQFQYRSGYQANPGRAWHGALTRADIFCGDDGEEEVVRDIGQKISQQGNNRRILSYQVDLADLPIDANSSDYVPLDLDNPNNWIGNNFRTAGEMVEIGNLNDCDVLDRAWASSSVCSSKKQAVDHIAPKVVERGLADIYNSTPTVLGKPAGRLPIASYQTYRSSHSIRRPHLFVGTNDGVVHAIDNKLVSSEPSGGENPKVERWGFIPNSLLRMLPETVPMPNIAYTEVAGETTGHTVASEVYTDIYQHLYLMDTTLGARDVLLFRNVATFNQGWGNAWRALVFGTSGKSARTIFALDVTDVVEKEPSETDIAPHVRFEINPDEDLWGNNGDAAKAALRRMGKPVSPSTLAYVNDDNGSDAHIISAAMIVPGGWKDNPNPNAPDSAPEDGNSGVYIIRLGDGKVLRYLEPMSVHDSDVGPDGKNHICTSVVSDGTTVHRPRGLMHHKDTGVLLEGAQLIGQPVIPFGTRNLKVTTEAFIGDDRGRIWLVDMSSKDPDDWCLEIYFDTLIAWQFPYEDCHNACDINGVCASTCDVNDNANATLHEDTCTGTYKDSCDHTLLSNMNAPRTMMLGPPAVATTEKEEEVVLVFGTGQYDDLMGWSRNRVFSVTDTAEEHTVSSEGDKRIVHTPTVNWWLGDKEVEITALSSSIPVSTDVHDDTFHKGVLDDLLDELGFSVPTDTKHVIRTPYTESDPDAPSKFWNTGEKLVGRPVVFDDVAYFTTFVPLGDETDNDACEDISSRIWAVDYNIDYAPSNIGEFGKFPDGSGTGYRAYINFPNEILSGVQVVKKLRCDPEDEAAFELVVQKVDRTVSTTSSTRPSENAITVAKVELPTPDTTQLVSVRFDSWSLVF